MSAVLILAQSNFTVSLKFTSVRFKTLFGHGFPGEAAKSGPIFSFRSVTGGEYYKRM